MRDLPSGLVTFLFTDIEGSTRLWESDAAAMRVALARHDALIEAAVEANDGAVVRPRGEGDSRFAVFAQATSGVAAAASIQQALYEERWPTLEPLRVRMAVHTGEADLRLGDYYGATVNRCARLRAIAYGGQTILSNAVVQLVQDYLTPDLKLTDLGEHRLKDLDRAEHVFQLTISSQPEDFPPLRSMESFPNNLPLQLTSFVGRETNIVDVKRLLNGTRLLTLTGSGGSGKTRLALQVAADLLESYANGVWLVELAPLTDSASVPAVLATVLGVRESEGSKIIEVLSEYLHDKQMLIVLDNCEHLIMACAQLAETLLHACPGLTILATSREALGVLGETAWRIPSLGLPDSSQDDDIESLVRCEAIQLFMERARAARPDFMLTNQNAPAVIQVCRRLDGIPLAIELATTRIRAMSVEQIAIRLDDRFRLLTGGSRTALSRHQTLRTLIDWSYGLLTEPERILLRRLSVFVGGWTLEGCEGVCSGDGIDPGDVMDLLIQLVNKSLVTLEERDDDTRYKLLETIRQYAREKLLDAGEGEFMRDHHLAWYVFMTESLVGEFRMTGRLDMLKQRLYLELDNLYSALEWASSRDLEACFRLARNIIPVGRTENFHGPIRSLIPEALSQDTSNPIQVLPAARAGALWALGAVCIGQGDNVTGRTYLEESINIYRHIGEKRGLADALSMIAPAYALSGEGESAGAALTEAVQLYRVIGDKWGLTTGLESIALGMFFSGQFEAARTIAEQSLAQCEEIGDRWAKINPLLVLGHLAVSDEDFDTGRALLEESLRLCYEMNDPRLTARVSSALGNLARLQKDYETAKVIYAEVLDLWRRNGNRGAVALIHQIFGYIAVAQGDYVVARSHFRESLSIRQRLDNPLELAGPIEGFAALAVNMGNTALAARLLGSAKEIRGEKGLRLECYDAAEVEQTTRSVRSRLDASEVIVLFNEGSALSLERIVELAVGTNPVPVEVR